MTGSQVRVLFAAPGKLLKNLQFSCSTFAGAVGPASKEPPRNHVATISLALCFVDERHVFLLALSSHGCALKRGKGI
jgi:hypothetical protein